MFGALTEIMTMEDWRLIALVVACLGVSLFALALCYRGRKRNARLVTALNNMSEGLCMFDASTRLVLCNDRYVELYGLPPEVATPGVTLRELIEHRIRAGAFKGDPDEYVADTLRKMKSGQIVQDVRERPGGIFILVSSRPMAGGGWVATHQDITERRRQDQQRDSLVVQEQRRAAIDAAIAAFRQRIEAMLKTVSDSAGAMRSTATTLFASSHKASQRAQGAVHTSNEASTNVEIAASAANELSTSIDEISRQLGQTNNLVSIAASEAGITNSQIGSLAQAAQKIGDVVKLIRAIAEQTNLLALNATIEAARAGEAGKGFAVVAQEVKALAGQTAKATDEISAQIASMQTATQESVAAIKEIGATISRVSEIATAIAASMEEQGAATAEIARNVEQASHGTMQVASNITDVNRGTTETGSASVQVLASAQSLAKESAHLEGAVSKFLATVRAA
jgi:methyl-accepting chemotaxis protein